MEKAQGGTVCYGRTWVGEVFDRIAHVIRYVAPGFVALFTWMVVACRPPAVSGAAGAGGAGRYQVWALAGAAALVGLLVYAVHNCVLARLIWTPIVLSLRAGNRLGSKATAAQKAKAKAQLKQLLEDLPVLRLRRRISEDRETRAVQRGLDRWRAMCGFLYCSGYVLIGTPSLVMCPKTEAEPTSWASHVVVIGVVVLVAALISDYMQMKYELWAGETYKTGMPARRASRRR